MTKNIAPCKMTWCEQCGSVCGSAVSNYCTCKPLVNSQLRRPLFTLDTPGLLGLQRLGWCARMCKTLGHAQTQDLKP